MLEQGVLAFAPASPEVLRLADHMSKKHEFFSDVFHGVFPTEAEGTDFALNGGQRMWALVVFTKGPSSDGCGGRPRSPRFPLLACPFCVRPTFCAQALSCLMNRTFSVR